MLSFLFLLESLEKMLEINFLKLVILVNIVALKRAVGIRWFDEFAELISEAGRRLTTETVESAALALECVDDIHGGDGLSLGVLAVGDGVTDHVLEEDLKNTASFLVDQAWDTLDSTTTSQSSDGWLGDTLDVITKNFAMALGTSFSETLASFTTSGHVDELKKLELS